MPKAAVTTFSAASFIPVAAIMDTPDSLSIFRAISALVPSSRTTTGTSNPNSFTAWTTPFATRSQRTIPPKILIKTAFTFLSDKMILKPF